MGQWPAALEDMDVGPSVDPGQRSRPAVVWGATGQAKVLKPMLAATGYDVAAVCDRNRSVGSPFPGTVILHSETDFLLWLAQRPPDPVSFVVAIGGTAGRDRLVLDRYLSGLGLSVLTLVHDRAWVDPSARIGAGSQVAALAGIAVETRVGRQCIVNTGATIDHECEVGDGVHVMPGATVAGCVEIGAGATIGSNATVLPRVRIGEDAIVGAGAVVTGDVADGTVVVGVPARTRGGAVSPTPRPACTPWH